MKSPASFAHTALAAVVLASLVASPAAAFDDPVPVVRSEILPTRYIVEFEPGAVPVAVRADHPDAPEIARDAAADAIADDVIASGGEVVYDYDDLPFVAIETDDLAEVWSMPGVVNVTPEIRVTRTLDTSLDVIDASDSDLAAAIGGTKADGTGQVVAIIDDGIDRAHPFFRNASNQSRVIAEACFVVASSDPDFPRSCPDGASIRSGVGAAAHHPGDYHGTHVAGIAAGNSHGTSTIARGVAGNADIVAVQVFDQDGGASSIDIDRALAWVKDRVTNDNLRVAAVNLSLGDPRFLFTGDCYANSSTKNLVDQLASVGVAVVVAAGNSSWKTGVSWPACLPNVIPVGSSTDTTDVSTFSNIGPQVASRGVVAPGSSIWSSLPTASFPTGYGSLNGTSMAAPHVAGLAALVRQADPNATTAAVKIALRTTSDVFDDRRSGGTVTGLRRINAWSAIGSELADQGEISGTIFDVTGGGSSPLVRRTVGVVLTSNDRVSGPSPVTSQVATDAQGRYRLRVPAGTWSSIFTYSEYDPSSSVNSPVVAGAAVTRNVSVSIGRGVISGSISQPATPFVEATFTLTPSGSNTKAPITYTENALPNDGSFTLTGVRIGTWNLVVSSGENVSEPIAVTITDGATATIALPISLQMPTGTISLTLTDSVSGSPVQDGVTVTLTPEGPVDSRLPMSITTTSNAGGQMSVAGVRTGSWTIVIDPDDYATRSVSSVAVTASATTNVPAILTPLPGSVTGSVTDQLASASAGGQTIVVDDIIDLTLTPVAPLNGRTTMTLSQSLAATNGIFSIQNVTPGAWALAGRIFGYAPLPSTSVTVAPNGAVDLGAFSLTRRTAVASVAPTSGTTAGGTIVTINGRHLTGATAVTFNGVSADPASITVENDTRITVRTPAASAGSGNVVVTTTLGTSSEIVSFTFTSPVVSGGGGGGGGGALWPATQTFVPPPSGELSVRVTPSVGAVDFALKGALGPGKITVDPRAGRPPTDKEGILLPTGWLDIQVSLFALKEAEICAPIGIFDFDYYDITTNDLRMFHWEDGVRRDITTRVDSTKKQVCGLTSSFSSFAVGALLTDRVAGNDRFDTAVELSKDAFRPGVDVAFVVTGEKFPDALAAGAAAGRLGGPVLLTRSGSLPTSTRTELQRLKPKRVLVVGGPDVISDAVIAQVQAAVGSVSVKRLWGADRFDTSVQVSAETVSMVGGTVYLGSGLGFTEILAASAAAGRDDAPLLLVPGTGPNARVPLSVGIELVRLAPSRIVVVGGSTLVAPQIVDQVKRLVPRATVAQIGGTDAYDTASKIARTFAPGGTVYVATGDVFADGLAGGAAAVMSGSAMVMVPPRGSLQATVRTTMATLRPRRIVVLGGPAAIDHDIENAVAKYLPS